MKNTNKSQDARSRKGVSDSQSFHPDKEDVDFEILDALAQIEHAGEEGEEDETMLPESDENAFALTLDEEELDFEGTDLEEESEFRFDESVAAGLEEELEQDAGELSFDESLGEEGEAAAQMDMEEEAEFDLDIGTEEAASEMSTDLELPEFDLDSADQDGMFPEGEFDLGEEGLGLSSSEESFESEEFTEEESLEAMEFEEEMPELQDDIELDATIGEEEDLGEEEFAAADFEEESEEFLGKAVLSVDGEEVIDLGDETAFEEAESLEMPEEFLEDEALEAEASLDLSEEEAEGEMADLQEDVEEREVSEFTPEQDEEDEEFMASLEDIDIDLGEEPPELSELSSTEDLSEFAEESSEFEVPSLDAAEPEEQTISAPMLPEPEALQEEAERITFGMEETEPVAETVPDDREFLGLSLRLTNAQVDTFAQMVSEAKTLQGYVDELQEHESDINDRIYQKLLKEYYSRKLTIFKKAEFLAMETDVAQDLKDMLAKRQEFLAAIGRLNEALEEVKVRHLVGEYTDAMLAERETAQKTEIAQWQTKTEKIEQFITRYQDLLDTERALNPLGQTSEEELPEEEVLVEQEQAPEYEPEETETAPEERAEEMETESLPDSFPDEIADEWEAPEEEVELTAEGWTEQEMPEESELEEEDFELDEFSTEGFEEEPEEEPVQEEMISCKKCGRPTPASEKFCVNCGAKAR